MSCACDSGIRVSGGPRAAGEARSALSAELDGRVPDDCMRDLHLLASEVVNNSVLHGEVGEDGWIDIDYSIAGATLHVRVRDSGIQGQPRIRKPDFEHGGGFGLFLVEALSSRWGVDREPVTVWFELALGKY